MITIKRIQLSGYRGPGTENQFLPPDWYEVGDHLDVQARIVPDDLARYLVETGQVVGVEAMQDGESPIPSTSRLVASEPVVPDEVPTGDDQPTVPDGAPDEPIGDELVEDTNGEVWNLTLLRDMTADELRELAASEGVELPKGRTTKDSIINRIVTGQ